MPNDNLFSFWHFETEYIQFVTLTIRDITIRDISINLKIDIIVLNLSYFMLCDDCQIATYVYVKGDVDTWNMLTSPAEHVNISRGTC